MSQTENAIPNVSPAAGGEGGVTRPLAVPTPAPRILAILGAIFGGFLLLLSLCGMIAYLVLPLQRAQDVVLDNTLIASVVALCLIYGALILGLALDVLRRRPFPRLSLPPALLFAALFILVIGIGQGILTYNLAPAYLFPPWHVLASGMLPLAVLAYAARRLPAVSGPTVVAQLTWGGVGTVLLALVFELIVGVLLLAAVAVLLALVMGPNGVQQLIGQLRPLLGRTPNLEAIVAIVTRQPVLLITVGAAAIAMFTVIVPLIEESLKSLGPAISIAVSKPPITRALLWGIAAGAGYAFSENLLNGASGVTADAGGVSIWAFPMTLRAGTSLVHIATTATISLGWYVALVRGQRAQFFLYLIAGLAAHGFWNLVSVIASGVLSGLGLSGSGPGLNALSDILGVMVVLLLLVMIFAAGAWIVWLVHWARRTERRLAAEISPPN